MNKKGFEFNFQWIFAIIVGAAIIFIAIYAASKIISTGTIEVNTITAKQLSIIFEPLETGLAAGIAPKTITLKQETIIYNECIDKGNFGKQLISLAGVSNRKVGEVGVEIGVPNKYIFSNSSEQGRIVYYFSMPLELPFKVSELIFLSTKKFCFVNAPDFIEEEASFLMPNLKLSNCSAGDIKVCFGQGSCNIKVSGGCYGGSCDSEYDYGTIAKNGKTVYYVKNLMYGAIFASPEIYECNVKRLMSRLSKQALLLKSEADFLTGKCESSGNQLLQLSMQAKALSNSNGLVGIYETSKDADRENDVTECELW